MGEDKKPVSQSIEEGKRRLKHMSTEEMIRKYLQKMPTPKIKARKSKSAYPSLFLKTYIKTHRHRYD